MKPELSQLNAYEIREERRLDDIHSDGMLLVHKKSGARICVMSNEDVNKVFYIAFRTPPMDSTGVPHIIEHTVLCGSKKFPVKDPFIELVKGSLNTFLNAMTYPDKTIYPVASCNDKDFQNLMDVYLDSVFSPNIYKEQNILFPLCAVNFTEDEWKGIYQDAKDYAVCFGAEPEVWDRAENVGRSEFGWQRSADGQQGSAGQKNAAGEIVMPGGHITLEQLTALLNTVPLEISFIDTENINRFFNEGPKVFKRPAMAIDREVFSCHPPKIEPMVRAIIEDFRNNKRNRVPVWMEKGGRTMLVTYMAVRDKNGKYLGTAEFVQDMEFAKEHFGK